jgi:hypothetical protein
VEAREQALIAALEAREVRAPYDFATFTQRAALGHRRARLTRGLAVSALTLVMVAGLALLASSAWQKPGAVREQADSARQRHRARILDPELLLASMPSEPGVVRFETRVAVTELEDRIALLDDAASAAAVTREFHPELVSLRDERERLVRTLAQLRYAEQLASANY